MTEYHDRVIQHSLKWVNGNPQHNRVDDECVADFSCCHPAMYTKSLEQRQTAHRELVKRLRPPQS